jgi:ribosomal protein L11 methyltransferase
MYLWRKSASEKWWRANELRLRAIAGDRLAVIDQLSCKQLHLEIGLDRRAELQNVAKQFGGHIEKLPRNWLKQALRCKTQPVKVGNHRLTIPAGAAFGTGEHSTTAMCLRFLERLTRDWDQGWSMIDLGTGSGILALAAKLLGAKKALGIDHDPIAIRTAKQNARLNKIRGVTFRVSDVRGWGKIAGNRLRRGSVAQSDVVTANLFSELLIEILPTLTRAHFLILSGILRPQEIKLTRALARGKIDIVEVRRSGKWVAMLGRRR